MNSMREIRIEKVTLNIGCAGDAQKIEKAKKLLEMISGRKPVATISKRRSTFGIPKGKPVGVKVTLRNEKAEEVFKKILEAVERKVKISQFDKDGNLNIGIKEYIDIPGLKYQHDIGLMGLDAAVTFERPGYRIKRRKICRKDVPKKHKVNKEEVLNLLKNKHGVQIE